MLFSLLTFFPGCKQGTATSEATADTPENYPYLLSADTLGDTLQWKVSLQDGKAFTILEDKSMGYSISNILVLPSGFGQNDSLLFEGSDPVENIYVTDLDEDGYAELFIVLRSAGSGAYAGLTGFAVRPDWAPVEISTEDFSESETVPEKIKKGYRGHDEIRFEKDAMVVTFPLYREEDPNADPTGGEATLIYKLAPVNGKPLLKIQKAEAK